MVHIEKDKDDLAAKPFWSYLVPLFQNVQNLSYENAFDLLENERVGGTHFHMSGYARGLVLTQRQNTTRKWPVLESSPPKLDKHCQCGIHSNCNNNNNSHF